MNEEFDRFFLREEVYIMLKMMYLNKVFGFNGLNVKIFFKFWYIVGYDVIDFVIAVLEGSVDMTVVNFVNIVLISKKK